MTLLLLLLLAGVAGSGQSAARIRPSAQQLEWQDLEFGVIIHFGPNTFLNQEVGDGTASPAVFDPTRFDPGQWMRAIRAAGARYVVFVAKHHDGFCLWPTQSTDYSVKASPWRHGRGDVVGAVERAARRAGLRFGIYLSPWDRHDPRYKDAGAYDALYRQEMDELTSRYGNLVEWWLDGAGSAGHTYNFKSYVDELRIRQPNTLVFADMALFAYGDIRWAGNEDGDIPYQNWNVIDRHGVRRWRPVEADTPLHNRQWFWHTDAARTLKTLPELLRMYEHTVGRGGQLMLGVAPDRRGLLPAEDVARLAAFGAAIRDKYGPSAVMAERVRATPNAERAFDGDPDTFWTAPRGSHHATLELDFPAPVTLDRALTMEWLNDGQRIERYRIEAWEAGGWKTLVASQAIGHMKIDRFAPATTRRVRLNILAATGTARIRTFRVYAPGARP